MIRNIKTEINKTNRPLNLKETRQYGNNGNNRNAQKQIKATTSKTKHRKARKTNNKRDR